MDTSAVILAVASPPGRSWRGIVRISGDGCLDLLASHVASQDMSRGIRATRLSVDGLDVPCQLLVSPGPRSYTGEDAAEIQLPGNPTLLQRLIDALLASAAAHGVDARRAEPGEFTLRGFLHGRLGLTEAEGVAATIAARSDAQLRAARLLADGSLGVLARELADDLADTLALVEAGIDFTDQEDVVAIAPDQLLTRLQSLHRRLEAVVTRSVGAETLEAIPWVVLTGPPNAGKSTLFNALLGHPRAVVSDVPGTTRDVLTEPLAVGGAEVMLVDLAGADETDTSPLNRQMQSAARNAIDRAELVLRCVEGREPAPGSDAVVVRTKCDLGPVGDGDVAVSAMTGEGLDELRALIAERLSGHAVSLAADGLALQPRHDAALRDALDSITETQRLVDQPELAAATMRVALDALGALAGDIAPDDVLGRIFASFCVGK